MMILEFLHEFKGFNRVPSRIHVKVCYPEDTNINKVLICFIDLDNGTSVTNATEQLAAEVLSKIKVNPKDCRFFETYQQYDFDDFDEIEYFWTLKDDKWIATSPKWKPASKAIKDLFSLEE